MTTYFDEPFAGGAPGASLTNVNTTFDLISGTAPTFVADSPIPGAQSMLVNVGGAALSSGRAQLGASRSIIFINYPIKANAAWAAGNWFPHEARATATIRADVRIPSGVPTMRNATTAVWTSGVTLATGVWLTCEHKIDNTAGKQSYTVWDATGAVVVASGDQTYSSGTMDNVAVGNTVSIASVNVSIGRVRIADTSLGPIAFVSATAENVTPALTGQDATAAVTGADGGASLSVTAADPGAAVAAADTGTALTFAANDATVSTSSATNAPASAATPALAAADPAAGVAPTGGTAAASTTAGDPAPAVAASTTTAGATFTAGDPGPQTYANAQPAAWTIATGPAGLAAAANAEAAAALFEALGITATAPVLVILDVDIASPSLRWRLGRPLTGYDMKGPLMSVLALGDQIVMSVLSCEYIEADVRARDSDTDPTGDAVSLAFIVGGGDPAGPDWVAGSWRVGVSGAFYARALVGPGGGKVLPVGTYVVWVKFTDDPEAPARQLPGSLRIK